MLEKINQSVGYIANHISIEPVAGIMLGSGLDSFTMEIDIIDEIPFSSIPHFPVTGVKGHKGMVILGFYKAKPLLLLQGRVHFYEGFTMDQVTYPVRVMKNFGIETLLLTNAAGGLNPAHSIGDLMAISDHINLMPNPLIGVSDRNMGPQFPDMGNAYDTNLIEKASAVALKNGIKLHKGVYVGVTGPTYETPAEYKYFRLIGGDAVGMSTIPEIIVARQMGMRCFALSVITDLGVPGKIEFLSHKKVWKEAVEAEPNLAVILKGIIEYL